MNYTFSNSTTITSSTIIEDYFPIIIEYDKEELNNKFIEFNYQDTDMLEISVNPKTNLLKRLSLSLCNHYSIEDAMLSAPASDEGSLSIEGPASTECDKFLVKVFNDGIQIDLSSKEVVHNYKCGQVIYSISADNTLTAVYIPSLAENELAHAKRELLGE